MFRSPRVQAVSAAVGLGTAALVLRLLPSLQALLPPCPFHLLTGLECPGCGMTRAFAALFTGDLASAFLLNPFAPMFAAYLSIRFGATMYRNSWEGFQISPRMANALLAVA